MENRNARHNWKISLIREMYKSMAMRNKKSYLIFDSMKRMKSSRRFHSLLSSILFSVLLWWKRARRAHTIAHSSHSKHQSSHSAWSIQTPNTNERTKVEEKQKKLLQIRWKNDIMLSRKKMENIFWHSSFCALFLFRRAVRWLYAVFLFNIQFTWNRWIEYYYKVVKVYLIFCALYFDVDQRYACLCEQCAQQRFFHNRNIVAVLPSPNVFVRVSVCRWKRMCECIQRLRFPPIFFII